MTCEYNRRIILSWIKTMNCSLTIAVKILSPHIKLTFHMMINKGLLISAKVKKHNYPHGSQILLIKSKTTKVKWFGALDSTFG